MVQQPFNETTRKTWFPDAIVPVRNVTRYRIQISIVSSGGAGFFATISPDDCVVNVDGGYVEIVPLQALTYALAPVLLQLGLKPPLVDMDVAVGGFWAKTYTLALHAQPLALPPVPPVVYVNGSVVSNSTYTINYTEGKVTFNTQQTPSAIVTCDYTQTIPDQVTEAAALQVSYLLSQRALNKLGLYQGLFKIRTGEQEIDFPRSLNVGDQGRSTASSLCAAAASVLNNLEGWPVA